VPSPFYLTSTSRSHRRHSSSAGAVAILLRQHPLVQGTISCQLVPSLFYFANIHWSWVLFLPTGAVAIFFAGIHWSRALFLACRTAFGQVQGCVAILSRTQYPSAVAQYRTAAPQRKRTCYGHHHCWLLTNIVIGGCYPTSPLLAADQHRHRWVLSNIAIVLANVDE
jgi:hypothetical protein